MTKILRWVQEEVSQDCPQIAVRLLLLKRQHLLVSIFLWDIDVPRVQQAWLILAENACAFGHGDAICADANIGHVMAFAKLAMIAFTERLGKSGQQLKRHGLDTALSCIAKSCILAAQAINTAVQAVYQSEAPADPDVDWDRSPRCGHLLQLRLLWSSSARLAQELLPPALLDNDRPSIT